MFSNVGRKIKMSAKVLLALYSIFTILMVIVAFLGDIIGGFGLTSVLEDIIGFVLVGVLGLITILPVCWMIYGFGELVESKENNRN